MNKNDIEQHARNLQLRILEQLGELFPGRTEISLVEILDPAIAARVLEIRYEQPYELRLSGLQATRSEVAGLINRQAKKIAVATKFPVETARFTGAHEIGHWLLHPNEIMHRDRPIRGLSVESYSRPRFEREADYFSACFLVPRKRLLKAFQTTLRTNVPFIFDDNTSFMLCPNDAESLLRAEEGSLDRALALASATSYAGRHFNSLASQFGVSVTTMAIRLKEVGLIQE